MRIVVRAQCIYHDKVSSNMGLSEWDWARRWYVVCNRSYLVINSFIKQQFEQGSFNLSFVSVQIRTRLDAYQPPVSIRFEIER